MDETDGDAGDADAVDGGGDTPDAGTVGSGGLVEWRDWGRDAFAAAARQGKPVVLSLTAPWCLPCREMDETTYAEPRIAAHLQDGFVAVRVDADRHPRVRERYNMGGFPSTVFCTPDGEILTGAGYLGPEGFRGILDSVRETWDAKGTDAGRVPRALRDPDPPAGELTPRIEAHVVEQVRTAFDDEFGGWGTDAKFPLPRTVEFAAKRERERATRTLEAIQTHLYDTYDGGFYRFAENRDWSGLHREKLLDENAGLVRAFATGYLYTGEETYRKTAAGTVDYLTTDLWVDEPRRVDDETTGHDPGAGGGAFAGSQAGGDYFTLEPTEREEAGPPHVDPTVFADRNGLAVDALLWFAAYTDHEAARRYAERALEYVLDTLVDGDGAVTHYRDGDEAGETGVLLDQARVLTGLTTAAQVLGGERYPAAAERVAGYTLANRRAPDGAFLDGPREGPGMLDRPLRPLDANVECADALVDLWALTGEDRYRATAREALSAFAGAHDRMGVEVAGYATAATRVVDDLLVVETPPAGSDLHRAALRLADHEKVVVPGARERAVLRRGDTRREAGTPAELAERAAGGRDE